VAGAISSKQRAGRLPVIASFGPVGWPCACARDRVVIEDDHILLLDQDADAGRSWSLPGGKVQDGETLAAALAIREETGLDVEPGRSLYVCDHLPGTEPMSFI
jgi:ADP-ribose pyrophosphatase YjhB (NUDIX family)